MRDECTNECVSCARRHVVLPPDIAKLLPKGRLLSEVRAMRRTRALSRSFEVFLRASREWVVPLTDARATRVSQSEWRGLGVQQSRGWVHYAIHRPEPHIMLYRRKKTEES